MSTSLFKEKYTIRFRLSNTFDEPAVYDTKMQVHFFPNDIQYPEVNGKIVRSIQGVFNDGKWRQDSFYLTDGAINEILLFAIENNMLNNTL